MDTVDRILYIMNKLGLTAKEFAKKVGVSQGNITDWKTGRAKPSAEALLKISRECNVSVDYLLGNTDKISYEKELIRYLRPLNLSENEFDFIKEIVKEYFKADTEDDLKKIADKITSRGHKLFNKAMQVLEIISDLSDNYLKTSKLNQIRLTIEQFNSPDTSTTNDYYELYKNFNGDKTVEDNLLNALYNIDKVHIVSNALNSSYYNCPVYGRISAGQPNWAEECLEGYLPIDPNLMNIIDPEDHFFLRVNGESMNKIIKNGAYALIHKQDTVENGEIAVCLVDEFEATLKKFSKQDNLVVLAPESNLDDFAPLIIDISKTDFKILGKYVGKFEMNK